MVLSQCSRNRAIGLVKALGGRYNWLKMPANCCIVRKQPGLTGFVNTKCGKEPLGEREKIR
jgi:hypothetical protein